MSLIISKVFTYDEDAGNYIQAVEAVDGQALESATRKAINNFVITCKQDGIWSSLEQCGILCGARTQAGSLIPLVKPAGNANPVLGGTTGGWSYSRKTGLSGNGTNNYLDTNYVIPSGNQNNCHIAVYKSTSNSGGGNPYWIGNSNAGLSIIAAVGGAGAYLLGGLILTASSSGIGLHAVSRNNSASASIKRPTISAQTVNNSTSGAPPSASIYLFNTNIGGTPGSTQWSSAPLTFYSAGKGIDLDKLHIQVAELMTALAIAIP